LKIPEDKSKLEVVWIMGYLSSTMDP